MKGLAEEIILAGDSTCDSMDILYEHYRYRMLLMEQFLQIKFIFFLPVLTHILMQVLIRMAFSESCYF